MGAEQPRDLKIEGREMKGICFAMDFLRQQNKIYRGNEILFDERISAKGKNVIVLGGGDTGSDWCRNCHSPGSQKSNPDRNPAKTR